MGPRVLGQGLRHEDRDPALRRRQPEGRRGNGGIERDPLRWVHEEHERGDGPGPDVGLAVSDRMYMEHERRARAFAIDEPSRPGVP